MLFIKIGRELSAISQSSKSAAYTSSFGFLDVIRETGRFFRFGTCCYPAFAIFDNCAKHGKAIGTFDDLLATSRLVVPGIPLFFGLTVKIKMHHLGLNTSFRALLTEPDQSPLNGQVICRAISILNLHNVVVRI